MSPPRKSRRILETDSPWIVQMQRMLRGKTGLKSLAHGVVHWNPPPAALAAASGAAAQPEVSQYGANDGELLEALTAKVGSVNRLANQSVMVTAGANQGFANLVLALCDAKDSAVVFAPYYFNHHMALQKSSVRPLVGPCDPARLWPDAGWLREQLTDPGREVRMVVLCNPCNPTGALLPRALLEEISALCRERGCWLVVDNTYEDFVFEDDPEGPEDPEGRGPREGVPGEPRPEEGHACVGEPHVVNIFSFSKAYGMMGWRVGYLSYDDSDGLGEELFKAQDIIPICPSRLSQRVALAALKTAGPTWVQERIAESVVGNRWAVAGAIARALGPGAILGQPKGAIYLMLRLPPTSSGSGGAPADDAAATLFLAERHGLVVLPGSDFGAPGCLRVAFANLPANACRDAAGRLEAGLVALRRRAEGSRNVASSAG